MIELKLFQLLLNERFFFSIADKSRVHNLTFLSFAESTRFYVFNCLFIICENSRTQMDGKRVPDRYKGRAFNGCDSMENRKKRGKVWTD